MIRNGLARFGLTLATFVLATATALSPVGAAPRMHLSTGEILRRYFGDLNAHRYHAAWLLEDPCNVTMYTSNGPGAPMGSEGYTGRGAGPWQPVPVRFARHPILASAHVTGIKPLHIPILAHHHILAFGVSGWYTFDYSQVPWANMKHKNGFHTIKIAMWQCHGVWGIEGEEWLTGSGGELTWT